MDLHEAVTLEAVSAYVMDERPTDAATPLMFLVGGRGRRRCEPLSYAALARLFARACFRADIRAPWVTPHCLRHTHATRMWEMGMRELTLAATARSCFAGGHAPLHPRVRPAGRGRVPTRVGPGRGEDAAPGGCRPMRAGPVSAAALRVPFPMTTTTFLPHAHCGDGEYAAFLDALSICPAFRRQCRNHQRRFIRLWPDLGEWFAMPLVERVARHDANGDRRCAAASATRAAATSTISR